MISISDSGESSGESQVAGPSSLPGKKVKVEDGDKWDRLKETLLAARIEIVEIDTDAQVKKAKLTAVVEEAERELKGGK